MCYNSRAAEHSRMHIHWMRDVLKTFIAYAPGEARRALALLGYVYDDERAAEFAKDAMP